LFKAGNRRRKYQYGPGFQNHPVAKMAFDLEGQIQGQMRSNFFIFLSTFPGVGRPTTESKPTQLFVLFTCVKTTSEMTQIESGGTLNSTATATVYQLTVWLIF